MEIDSTAHTGMTLWEPGKDAKPSYLGNFQHPALCHARGWSAINI